MKALLAPATDRSALDPGWARRAQWAPLTTVCEVEFVGKNTDYATTNNMRTMLVSTAPLEAWAILA
jgi:hypothetical protein